MVKTRWSLAVPVLGAVLLAGVGLAATDAARAESNGGVRVMALGDSITDGFNVPGGYRNDLWQDFVSGGYKVDFVGSQSNGPASLGDRDHEGHSGWTIDQVSNNVVSWLQATRPQAVLLHIGTNDMGNASGAPSRLSALIDKITATVPDAEVFVATIIPLSWGSSGVQTFNAAIPGIVQTKAAAGRHVHLVEMGSALTTSDLADGVHPNAGGYAKMAAVWFRALQSVPGLLTGGTQPTSSPTPSVPGPTPTPTSGPGAPGCTATYAVVNQWQGGFQANVTVTAGTAAISGWTVTWTYANGQTVSTSWNATVTSNGSTVTARNSGYNGSLGAGKSATFGLTGSWNGTNGVPSVACTAS